jgi:hypothetical protein
MSEAAIHPTNSTKPRQRRRVIEQDAKKWEPVFRILLSLFDERRIQISDAITL